MRGEGNHKIPGSFAPENMEKTGAERVKYSLACQHEDAISIKFVSYAQKCPTVLCTFAVALRKESVDRNLDISNPATTLPRVALRKESVDRNATTLLVYLALIRSLSARRAWIEITDMSDAWHRFTVALRKESVDRNITQIKTVTGCVVALRKESVDRNGVEIDGVSYDVWSLSARRAWIEITTYFETSSIEDVALRKESVDRNSTYVIRLPRVQGRSPQGERG